MLGVYCLNIKQMSSIIVIGSGIAGVSAAQALMQKGNEVIVLEAGDKIGGRLCTRNVNAGGKDFAFDLGASWIHGSNNENPVTELSKEVEGLQMVETDDDKMVVYNQRGQEIQKVAEAEYEEYQKIMDKVEQEANNTDSIQSALKKVAGNKLNNPVFMYHIANDMEFQTSAPINQLAAKAGTDDQEFEGTQMLIVSGYQNFAQTVADKNQMKVMLKHRVVSVSYSQQDEQTTVICDNGNQFKADYVVIAVPIGVLKRQAIKFNPPLAPRKQQAISNIGFGNVCKVLITFNSMPFKMEQHYIGVVADNVNDRGLFTYFLNVNALSGLPIMMTFGLGGNADQAETMPQAQAKQLIAQRINAFSEKKITPNDFSIQRTNWRTHPNFEGAYSYGHINTKQQDWEEIARPMFGQGWYFCGEHTSQIYRGTVHGALLSGRHAAEYIISDVKDDAWEYMDGAKDSESQDQGKKSNKSSKSGKSDGSGPKAGKKAPLARGKLPPPTNNPEVVYVNPPPTISPSPPQVANKGECCKLM